VLTNAKYEMPEHVDGVRLSDDGAIACVITRVPLDPGPARLYEARNGNYIGELGTGVAEVQFAGEGRWALCTEWQRQTADLWDVKTKAKLQSFSLGEYRKACISSDGSYVLIVAKHGATEVWKRRAPAKG
jgi:hypothetical protein